MITFIVPVFNAEKYIGKCIESILAQTHPDFELLLVNDGSSDESGLLCDAYAAQDVRVTTFHLHNGGPSKARNYGLERARGEWVCFIDADDWVEPDYLEMLIGSGLTADVTFFGFNKWIADELNRTCLPAAVPTAITTTSIQNAMYSLYENDGGIPYFGYTWMKIYKTSIIADRNIRFDERLRIKEDELFTLEYCRYIHSLSVLSKPLYNYRILNSSLSHANDIYADYHYLTERIKTTCDYVTEPKLKTFVIKNLFRLQLQAVVELIHHHNLSLAISDIDKLITTFQKYRHKLNAPKWFLAISVLPGLQLKRFYITLYIYLWTKIKSRRK